MNANALMLTDEQIVAIYVAHGTSAAARWVGISRQRVGVMARRLDAPKHPHRNSRHFRDLAQPRHDCACAMCTSTPEDEKATYVDPVTSVVIDPEFTAKWMTDALRSVLAQVTVEGWAAQMHLDPAGDEWRRHARCHGVDPDVFIPVTRGSRKIDVAKRICAACPVRTTCGTWAEENLRGESRIGVWGGRYLHYRSHHGDPVMRMERAA